MRSTQEIQQELLGWQSFEATCQEDYDHACQKVRELTAELTAHRCGICGRGEPTDGSFLGFHAHNRVPTGEVCDDCSIGHGCNCCKNVADFAWRGFLVEIGILENADDPRQYE